MAAIPADKKILVLDSEDLPFTKAFAGKGLEDSLKKVFPQVSRLPLVRFEAVEPDSALENELERGETADWMIFTSKRGFHYFKLVLDAFRRNANKFFEIKKTAAIGKNTADFIKASGLPVDFHARKPGSPDFIREFKEKLSGSEHLWLLQSDVANPSIGERLRSHCGKITATRLYRTLSDLSRKESLHAELAKKPDLLVFTSPSGIGAFESMAGGFPSGSAFACLGLYTAEALRQRNIEPDVVPKEQNFPGLVEALRNYRPNP